MSGRALNVWMNGELTGEWRIARSGAHEFSYAPTWAASPSVRALSLSLPLTSDRNLRGAAVENYFDNLLPDSTLIRERMRTRFGTRSARTFDLLAAIGRDCAGAVQLLPPEAAPGNVKRIDSTPVSTREIAQLLRGITLPAVPGAPGTQDLDDFRISIAGAQEKTALLRIGKQWHRPHGATPTTHILKLPLGLVGGRQIDMRESVENEWLCAQIAAALGLPAAVTEMAVFDQQKVLVVERFDRQWMRPVASASRSATGSSSAAYSASAASAASAAKTALPARGTWIARLPQEDFCQATGMPSNRKYESAGGPGMARCLEILAHSEAPDADRVRFIQSQLLFWLLAATDGHAKNFSLFHKRAHAYTLTPLYDVISMWPVIGKRAGQLSPHDAKLAMALRTKNAHYRLMEMQTRHWQALAQSCGVQNAWDHLQALVERMDEALVAVEAKLPANFPDAVWTKISKGMRAQAKLFRAGLVKH